MNRRGFLGLVVAAPVVAVRAADLLSYRQAKGSIARVEGKVVSADPYTVLTSYERQVKGGPTVEVRRYLRSYVVDICPAGCTVETIWRNGHAVYDTTGNHHANDYRAIAFQNIAKVYQERDRLLMSVDNDDLTDTQGAIPVYEFRVVR